MKTHRFIFVVFDINIKTVGMICRDQLSALTIVLVGCGRSEVLPEPFTTCVCASLACFMAQIVFNDVLWYLASAKNSTAKNGIIKKVQ